MVYRVAVVILLLLVLYLGFLLHLPWWGFLFWLGCCGLGFLAGSPIKRG